MPPARSRCRSGLRPFLRTEPPLTACSGPPTARCTPTSASGSPESLGRFRARPVLEVARHRPQRGVGADHVVHHVRPETTAGHLPGPMVRENDDRDVACCLAGAQGAKHVDAVIFPPPDIEE